MRVFPATVTPDGRRIVGARALRGLVDGFVSVLLASYLSDAGFSPFQVSAIVTGTLLGSAVLTLGIGLMGYGIHRRTLLLISCGLMCATGLGFVTITAFWPLLLVAIVGTMNPSSGDVSVFLPVEQALLAEAAEDHDRTALFARYNLGGLFAAAVGSLSVGAPLALGVALGATRVDAQRWSFLVYAVVAVALLWLYLGLRSEQQAGRGASSPLRESRSIVFRLSALFSLDSFGGGFVVQSLLTLWLFERFDLSVEVAGAIFFVAGLLSALSQLAAPRLAARIGLVNTMVFTHLPANGLLMAAAFMPNAYLAVGCLLTRMLFSSMDVPARQSYTMSVVPPAERAAAASVTNVPRSLAAALAPLGAGAMLEATSFGWPLIVGGAIKATYDILLWLQFRSVPPRAAGAAEAPSSAPAERR
ncbi:MAG: MFS transporter [Dehalococcoidia bacterium]|nr:MFS transporter [Dehalococcoidia bacterium]